VHRHDRKGEHLKAALKVPAGPLESGFDDVHLVPRCVPELSEAEVDSTIELFDKRLSFPVIINAMTGGTKETGEINRALAEVASSAGVGLAVGSQRIALESPEVSPTFRVVREVMPRGLVIANIGADCAVEEARRCVDMLEADALQIHLNAAQELAMKEGDRGFAGWLRSIEAVCSSLEVPVIAKEVGFGIDFSSASLLREAGVAAIDVGGAGGTNFVAIEDYRSPDGVNASLFSWGMSTVTSLVETRCAVDGTLPVIASGGVRSGLDVARAIALGAACVGMAGPLLKALSDGGQAALDAELDSICRGLLRVMILTGSRDIAALANAAVVVRGPSGAWLERRGFGRVLDEMARRR